MNSLVSAGASEYAVDAGVDDSGGGRRGGKQQSQRGRRAHLTRVGPRPREFSRAAKTNTGESRGILRESEARAQGKAGEAEGKAGPQRGKAQGKQGESRGKARGKQAEKRESRFLRVQTDPLFTVPAFCEIAPSQPFIILKGRKYVK